MVYCVYKFINFFSLTNKNVIQTTEIDDPKFLQFAVNNFGVIFGYIEQDNLNIRIQRDITGEYGLE